MADRDLSRYRIMASYVLTCTHNGFTLYLWFTCNTISVRTCDYNLYLIEIMITCEVSYQRIGKSTINGDYNYN